MALSTSIYGLNTQPGAKNIALLGVGQSFDNLQLVSDSADPKGLSGSAVYKQADNEDPADAFTFRVEWWRLGGGLLKYKTTLEVAVKRTSSVTDKVEAKKIISSHETIIPMAFGVDDDDLRRVLGQSFVMHIGGSVDVSGVPDLDTLHVALLGTPVVYPHG